MIYIKHENKKLENKYFNNIDKIKIFDFINYFLFTLNE